MFIKNIFSYEFAAQSWLHFFINRIGSLIVDVLISGLIVFATLGMVVTYAHFLV